MKYTSYPNVCADLSCSRKQAVWFILFWPAIQTSTRWNKTLSRWRVAVGLGVIRRWRSKHDFASGYKKNIAPYNLFVHDAYNREHGWVCDFVLFWYYIILNYYYRVSVLCNIILLYSEKWTPPLDDELGSWRDTISLLIIHFDRVTVSIHTCLNKIKRC